MTLAADSDSVFQADNRLPAMRLRSLCFLCYLTLILSYTLLQPANRQGQRCMQLLLDALKLDGGLDWTGYC